MSTPNFYTMENFNLYIKAYEPEEDYDDIFYNYDEVQMFYDDIFYGYDGFNELMENLNDDLTFHKLEIKGGYYSGVQIYVRELENPHELDNDDCRYYYDICRSQAIRKYDAEIRKINKWLDKTAVDYGWKKLYCIGIFSNGEAVYEYAR